MTHRLLMLGTGHIAGHHAEEFARLPGVALAAAVDTDPGRLAAFAAAHGVARTFPDLAAALEWGGFDAAVNATPDAAHRPTTLALVAAGKHVFCEKPLAPDGAGAREMTEAAERAGVVAMVNLTYRNAAAIQRARAMVLGGEIGDVRHVEASYLQSWLTAAHWGDWRTDERWLWRLSGEHGSQGVLGDVGIHILDFVTFGTGLAVSALSARLRCFPKAEGDRIGPYRLDANDSAAITAELENGALASVHMSRFATGKLNDLALAIHGTGGALRIWADHRNSTLEACLGREDREAQRWRPVSCPPVPRNERRFADALAAGASGEPTFRRAAEVQRLLDLCFASDREGRRLVVG